MGPIFDRPEWASAHVDGIAQGDPDQPIDSRLVVEVRAGIRRANNAHRNLQRAVQVGRAIGVRLLIADDHLHER